MDFTIFKEILNKVASETEEKLQGRIKELEDRVDSMQEQYFMAVSIYKSRGASQIMSNYLDNQSVMDRPPSPL